jgi:hypothetical protein
VERPPFFAVFTAELDIVDARDAEPHLTLFRLLESERGRREQPDIDSRAHVNA